MASAIIMLTKTMTKFSNVICYHQPDLSTLRTVSCLSLDSVIRTAKVNTSCLCKWTERVMYAR